MVRRPHEMAAQFDAQVRDPLWEIYERSEIQISLNSVRVVVPAGFCLGIDFVQMFDDTSVSWSMPSISAEIVDGEARVVIRVLLVDYCDDECHAARIARKAPVVSAGDAAGSGR